MRWIPVLLVLAGTAAADPQPSLDDFYERTRERDEGFTGCTGYCDQHYLASAIVGLQTANPSNDALEEHLANGFRVGGDFGVMHDKDIARTQVWADVLRASETGEWFTDLGWRVTAFKRLNRHKYGGDRDGDWHFSFDSVVARRTELQISDLADLVAKPYTLVDVEGEVAPLGLKQDHDTMIALPIGIAERMRWTDGGGFERRTTVSAAIAARGFPKDIRHHAQLDFFRIKQTIWENTEAWTVSAGYQRLPMGIDTLPIWALAGYEWAGPKHGGVFQVGGAYRNDVIDFHVDYARKFELDSTTAMFERVDTTSIGVRHHYGPIVWGLAFESVSIEDRGSLKALTPELGVRIHGFELGARYRAAWTHDVMFPADRFHLALDWLL